MNVFAVFLGTAYLLGSLLVACFGLLEMGFGENRTPEQQEEADRLGWLMIAVFGLAIVMVILLGLRRALLAGIAFAAQVVVGAVALLDWIESGLGPVLVALCIAGAGLGTLLATASLRSRDRHFG